MTKKNNKRLKRQKLKYNYIHNAKIYTTKELAKVIGRHPQSVLAYIKLGMPVISKPIYLVKGIDAKSFLRTMVAKNKKALKAGEFYCRRCRQSTISDLNKIDYIETGRILGGGIKQIYIIGFCQKCNYKVVRFSSKARLPEFLDAVTEPQEKIYNKGAEVLVGTSQPSLNAQKKGGSHG